jgi:2-methylisocitrate lyase-like PEP mutase family enzyme
MTSHSIADKRRAFRKLHESGCFVIPNPWDIGSARYLQHLGYKALATTSSGFAFSQGWPDYGVPLERVLTYCREMAEASDLPVNVDFESGFSESLTGITANVRRCIDTGVAGISIEDQTGDKDEPVFPFDIAVERVRAARKAIDDSKQDVMLIGRAEGFLVGRPDLDDVARRLKAFSAAGADCLYAPFIKTREQIQTLVEVVAPKPLNFLNSGNFGYTVGDLAAMGVRRISIGGTLARVAFTAFAKSAREIAEKGVFTSFEGVMPNAELNAFFGGDQRTRKS